jgi:hypothetical protein
MLRVNFILFFVFLAGGIASSLAQILILLKMTELINRRRVFTQRVDWPSFPPNPLGWVQVFREYRALHPEGRLSRLLIISTAMALLCFVCAFALLFGVVPRHSTGAPS